MTVAAALSAAQATAVPDVDFASWYLDDDRSIALSDAEQMLSTDEAARAGRFKFRPDRDRFVRGRGYLRQHLAGFLGAAPCEVPIRVGEYGKPNLPGDPFFFNVSHTDAYAVLALSRSTPVGIDIEDTARAIAPFELASSVFSGTEIEALKSASNPTRTFFDFWTAKEARMKVTGQGMQLEPRSIVLDLDGNRPVGYIEPRDTQISLRYVHHPAPNLIVCCAYFKTEKE